MKKIHFIICNVVAITIYKCIYDEYTTMLAPIRYDVLTVEDRKWQYASII